MQTNLPLLKGLDAPDTLQHLAESGYSPESRPRVNSHIHLPPNFSAFDTVGQAVNLAKDQQIGVLGVSNYYDYSVYSDFTERATQEGIFPLYGLEIIALLDDLVQAGTKINDPGNPGKMYLCGKGIVQFAPMNSEAQSLLQTIRDKDSERMAQMVARLAEVFAKVGLETGLDEAAVKAKVAKRHQCPLDTIYLQERHAAQAFQEAIVERIPISKRAAFLEGLFGTPSKADPNDAPALQNEIRSYLMKSGKSAYVAETFVGFDHAYRLILALGGIPCYPTLADGAKPTCDFETPVESLIARLKERKLHCAEFIPIRNDPEFLTKYVLAVRQAGMVATAGTEHNTLDLIPMEPLCVYGQAIPEPIRDIFWEGACVVAAHQYLVLHGKTGFVDANGVPNTAYATNEARISAFHKLGAAVIRQYHERNAK